MTGQAALNVPSRPATLGQLFGAFNRLALQGFGGVLPVAQRELVERRQWLTQEEFLALLSLGQVLPGPNIVNMALMIGQRFFGLRGAFTALAGLMCVPLVIVLVLAAAFGQVAHVAWVAGALRGMGVVAAGLVLALACKLAPALRQAVLGWPLAALIAALVFVAIGLLRWPMVWVVLGLGSLGCAAAWWRLGGE